MICRILLLIILTSCVSGSFVVNVTQTSYQAEENHNITLEWTFTTKPDRSSKTLFIICELFISDKPSVLYHVHEGVEVSESQDAKFSGRVQSDKDALREGRIRLQLSRLRTDDSGLYLCEVDTDYGFSVGRCRLNVTGTVSSYSVSSDKLIHLHTFNTTFTKPVYGLQILSSIIQGLVDNIMIEIVWCEDQESARVTGHRTSKHI
ncbi:unnamed protein product [Oreochromis niloticus]|nr:unnamed protein product [Mustela putorius furo]